LPLARDAATVVFGSVLQDLEPDARRNPAPDASLGGGGHVVDPAAREASDVIVRRRVSIEAHAARIGALGQESLGGKQRLFTMREEMGEYRNAHAASLAKTFLVRTSNLMTPCGKARSSNLPAADKLPFGGEFTCVRSRKPKWLMNGNGVGYDSE